MDLALLPLLAVIAAAWAAGFIAERIGYPSVLGELLAGIVLGPPLLGLLSGHPSLDVIAQLGILLMMLYVGMEIDPAELRKASGGGILAALGGFVTPFVLAYWVVTAFGGTAFEGLFVGMAAGVTSLATKSRILVDLHLLDTRIAHVMMAGALIADALSLIIFAGLVGAADPATAGSGVDLAIVIVKIAVFFGGAWALGVYVFPRLGAAIQKMGTAGGFTLIMLIMLAFSEGAHLAGAHGILGAFLAGLFLRESAVGRTVSRDIVTWVRRAALGFLAPVFFVTAGFEVDLGVIVDQPALLAAVIGVATVGKIVGTAVFYLPTGFGWREGVVLGAGMNGRGAVEIIIAQIGLSLGIISQEMFSVLVLMAVLTTASVPVLLKIGVAWLRRRGELVQAREGRNRIVIVGGGPVNRLLASLLAEHGPVTVVDTREDRCEAARQLGVEAVQGSALDDLVMSRAGAAEATHILAHTGNPKVDALACRQARDLFDVPERHLLFDGSGEDAHQEAITHIDARTAFGVPARLEEWDFKLEYDAAEAVNVPISRQESIEAFATARTGREPEPTAGTIRARPDETILPLVVRRGGSVLPVGSGMMLEAGDELVMLTSTTER